MGSPCVFYDKREVYAGEARFTCRAVEREPYRSVGLYSLVLELLLLAFAAGGVARGHQVYI